MKKILVLSLILITIVFIAACSQPETIKVTTGKENIVEITSSGFNPSSLTVKAGTKVTFLNKDSVEHWPASAIHPTHTVYPGSDIKKCGTNEQGNIFDACRGLSEGEAFSFTFNEKGNWKYHDHLNLNSRGEIIVE